MTTEVEKIQVDRTKKCPFLLRTFVRSGGFHPETAFDNGRVPTLDEHAVHAWGDSTLIDIVRALRAQTPSPSLPAGAFRNPGTRYSFRVVYYDRGNVASRELGHIGPRELNDTSVLYPSSGGQTPTPPTEPVDLPAESAMDADDDSPRKDRDDDDVLPPGAKSGSGGRAKSSSRTLDELRVQPGDWLSVSLTLPASAKPTVGPTGLAIRGADREREGEPGGHWRGGGGGGGGRGRPAGLVRGGGHLAFGRDRATGRDASPPRNRDGPATDRRAVAEVGSEGVVVLLEEGEADDTKEIKGTIVAACIPIYVHSCVYLGFPVCVVIILEVFMMDDTSRLAPRVRFEMWDEIAKLHLGWETDASIPVASPSDPIVLGAQGEREVTLPQDSEVQRLGVDPVGFWLLATQHFSRQEICSKGPILASLAHLHSLVPGATVQPSSLFQSILEIFVNTLLPASMYGFITTFTGILFSGAVGHQIDIRARLPTIRTCIATQKLFASMCYGLFLILFTRSSTLDSNIRRLFLAFIITCGCGLKLATVGMNVCVERDWVMAIAASARTPHGSRAGSPASEINRGSVSPPTRSVDHADRVLLELNTTLRRIDLISKLVAPLFVSLLTSTIGYMLSAVVLLSMSLATAIFEILLVGITYKRFPILAVPRPLYTEVPIKLSVKGIIQEARAWIKHQVLDWNEFIHHPIFLSSLSIALLYFNVLSFGSPFIAYLKNETSFSDPLIAGMRGLCVITGLFGTFAMPWLEKRIGLIRTGSWAIWSEALSLVPTVVCLFVGIDQRQRPVWNSILLFAGMAFSRIGLWSFDLTQLTQLQKALAHHPRQNTLSALQYSLQNIFDLGHYGLTWGWNRPTEFKYAAVVSLGATFVAALVYVVGYARPQRGHLFHFDKLRSQLVLLLPKP
ncbi:Ferroportin1 (FPN1), partial [Rhizoctonia solani]